VLLGEDAPSLKGAKEIVSALRLCLEKLQETK
jgi:hypothetical protein